MLLSSDSLLIESPNWHPGGSWIVVNADGRLLRVPLHGEPILDQVTAKNLPVLTNDHLVSPDGHWHYASGQDGHIWRLPWNGGRGHRITTDKEPERQFRHFYTAYPVTVKRWPTSERNCPQGKAVAQGRASSSRT